MSSSHLIIGRRTVPATSFPSLQYAEERLQHGAPALNLHEICLTAAYVPGAKAGDILKQEKNAQGGDVVVKTADTAPPRGLEHDIEGVSPTYIQQAGAHDVEKDPYCAEYAGRATWDDEEWAGRFPPRDPNEPFPVLAIANPGESPSEETEAPI